MKRVFYVILLASFWFVVTSCGDQPAVNTNGNVGGSDLSTININLPDRNNKEIFKQGPVEKLTGYELSIVPTESACQGGTSIHRAGSWDEQKIQDKVRQGCSYRVSLSLGSLTADKKKVDPAYFSNDKGDGLGTLLDKTAIENKASFTLQITVWVTQAGKNAGFQDGGVITPPGETDLNIDIEVVQPGEGDGDMPDFPSRGGIPDLNLVDGASVDLWGTNGVLDYTRIWVIGNKQNIRHIFFAIHGDGPSDYADSTKQDRLDIAAQLPSNEGAILAHPVATGSEWPAFQGASNQRKNGIAILKMYRQLEKAAGKPNIDFQTYSLSGGGRFDHGLLRLINEKYSNDDTGLGLQEFVDKHVHGMYSGESLSYDLNGPDGLDAHWIKTLKEHPQIRFVFVHNPNSDQFRYMVTHANNIIKALGFAGFNVGETGSFANGRIRYWTGSDHFHTWKGYFAVAFLKTTPPSTSSYGANLASYDADDELGY